MVRPNATSVDPEDVMRQVREFEKKFKVIPLVRVERAYDLRNCIGAGAMEFDYVRLNDEQQQAVAEFEQAFQDLVQSTIGPAVAVVAVAVPFLEEFLVFALQVVLQHDAVDVRAFVAQPFGLLEVRAIELRVVLQLPRSLDAVVELLRVARVSTQPACFEQVAALVGQRDDGRITIEADGVHEAGIAQMPQFAVARVERTVEGVAEVVGPDDAEGADRSQRARLGAAEGVVVAVIVDVFAFEATRQVDVFHEPVARVHALPVAPICTAAAAAAEVAGVVIAITRVVTPARIEHRAPLSETSAFSRSRCRPTELPVQCIAGPRNQGFVC
jgi:hypothetical protein